MRLTTLTVMLGLTGLLAGGCSDEATGTDAGPDAGTADAGKPDAGRDGGRPDSGPADAGPPKSCANPTEALDLTVTDTISSVVDPPDGANYYTFDVPAEFVGKYLWLIIQANPNNQEGLLDSVITLYNGTGATPTQVAENDDGYPIFSMDSEIIYRVPQAATYCVKVQDWSTWKGEQPAASPDFSFTLQIAVVDTTVASVANDTEPNNAANQAQTWALNTTVTDLPGYGMMVGTFGDAADVDVLKFAAPALGVTADLTMVPPGTTGYGSTEATGVVKLTDEAGTITLAQLDFSKGSDNLSVPVVAGTNYLLWVNRKDATVGANDFYVGQMYVLKSDSPKEAETTAGQNDTQGTAETITFDVTDRSGYILGFMNAASDVDFFKITSQTGEGFLSLACGSLRSGSGIQGATFAIVKSDGTVMQTETETDAKDVSWNQYSFASMARVILPAAGDYFLKVTATGLDPNVTSYFYRCGIYFETQ